MMGRGRRREALEFDGKVRSPGHDRAGESSPPSEESSGSMTAIVLAGS
jgi:hypothetical protein